MPNAALDTRLANERCDRGTPGGVLPKDQYRIREFNPAHPTRAKRKEVGPSIPAASLKIASDFVAQRRVAGAPWSMKMALRVRRGAMMWGQRRALIAKTATARDCLLCLLSGR
jgi:hypothetical protein